MLLNLFCFDKIVLAPGHVNQPNVVVKNQFLFDNYHKKLQNKNIAKLRII